MKISLTPGVALQSEDNLENHYTQSPQHIDRIHVKAKLPKDLEEAAEERIGGSETQTQHPHFLSQRPEPGEKKRRPRPALLNWLDSSIGVPKYLVLFHGH